METTVIYADILFAINFVTDGLCLAVTALMMGRRFVKWRFICGCVMGGLYAPAALMIGEKLPYLAVLIHLAAAVLICLVSYPTDSFKSLAASTACFFVACALLGGAMCGVYSMCGAFAMYRGAFYADLSPGALIASALIAFIAIVFCIGKAKGRVAARHCELKITYRGRQCDLFCLADSGNLMHCPYTALPVVSVKGEAVKELFTEKELEELKEAPVGEGIRPIPARGLGGSIILPSFIPEKTLVRAFGRRDYKERRLCIAIDFGGSNYGGCDGAAPATLF